MAEVFGAHEIHPLLRRRRVDGAGTAGFAGAVLGHEQGHAAVEGRLGFGAQAGFVRGGIKVQRVGDVGASQRAAGGHVHVLRPRGRAHDDEVVGVDGPDGVGYGLGVGLHHAGPRHLQGLVVHLVNHVRRVAVGGGHLPEKGHGLRLVLLGVVAVPVDDDVESGREAGIDHGFHLGFFAGRVFEVAAGIVDAHGHAHEAGVPVGFQPAHHVGRVVALAAPAVVAPKEAVAGQPHRLPTLVENAVALHPQGSRPRHGCLGLGPGWRGAQQRQPQQGRGPQGTRQLQVEKCTKLFHRTERMRWKINH